MIGNLIRLRRIATILAVFLLGGMIPSPGRAVTNNLNNDAEPTEYTLEDIQGSNVKVLEAGQTQWEMAEEGQVLEEGDEIKAGGGSEATLMLQADTSVHLYENSDMAVEKFSANETNGFFSRLKVLAGSLLADVKKNLGDSHSTFEVDTNGVVCGVRGTAFEVSVQGDQSDVSTHEGKVEVTGDGESHWVNAGNDSSFRRGRFLMLRRLNRVEMNRFEKWRAFRQIVRQRRMRRLAAIRNHARRPWVRRHPRMGAGHPLLRRNLEKRREMKRLIRKKRQEENP